MMIIYDKDNNTLLIRHEKGSLKVGLKKEEDDETKKDLQLYIKIDDNEIDTKPSIEIDNDNNDIKPIIEIRDHSSNKINNLIHVLLINIDVPANQKKSELKNRIVDDIIYLQTVTISILNMKKVQKYLKLWKKQTKR